MITAATFALLLAPTAQAIVRGINWFGLETEHKDLMCLWQNPIDWHLEKIHELGFTHMRIPFSYDYVQEANWARMDELFAKTQMNITLDFHRVHNTHQSQSPTAEISLDEFIRAWETIINRYKNSPKLEYVDIFNEFQSQNWSEWSTTAREILLRLGLGSLAVSNTMSVDTPGAAISITWIWAICRLPIGSFGRSTSTPSVTQSR